MNRILRLTLKKEWFDLIKSGKKKIEYREVKDYWTQRLTTLDDGLRVAKVFDYVIFKNGYDKDAPTIKVEWKGLAYSSINPLGVLCYAIALGDVIE